jgi:hypothetical protein
MSWQPPRDVRSRAGRFAESNIPESRVDPEAHYNQGGPNTARYAYGSGGPYNIAQNLEPPHLSQSFHSPRTHGYYNSAHSMPPLQDASTYRNAPPMAQSRDTYANLERYPDVPPMDRNHQHHIIALLPIPHRHLTYHSVIQTGSTPRASFHDKRLTLIITRAPPTSSGRHNHSTHFEHTSQLNLHFHRLIAVVNHSPDPLLSSCHSMIRPCTQLFSVSSGERGLLSGIQ